MGKLVSCREGGRGGGRGVIRGAGAGAFQNFF